jgi:transporter family-2 protein
VAIAAFGAPKVGVGPLLTAAIGGQLIGAIILDHYGLLGLARQPVSVEKIGGVLLVLVGAWLVRRG